MKCTLCFVSPPWFGSRVGKKERVEEVIVHSDTIISHFLRNTLNLFPFARIRKRSRKCSVDNYVGLNALASHLPKSFHCRLGVPSFPTCVDHAAINDSIERRLGLFSTLQPLASSFEVASPRASVDKCAEDVCIWLNAELLHLAIPALCTLDVADSGAS